ncbi:MAG: AI-2E family transporter [Acidobacteriaceae bacterium]|nr:AI-2E family transporter [Acidobacteriaceae bacterium]
MEPRGGETSDADKPAAPLERASIPQAIRRDSAANIVLALIAIAAALHFAQLVWVVICVSILLAFILEPVVVLIEKLRLPRGWAALVALLALFAVLYGISAVFYKRAVEFSQELPTYAAEIRQYVEKFREKTENITAPARAAVPKGKGNQTIQVVQQPSIWNEISSSLGTATDVALAASFVPFLAYFMLSWKDHTRRATVLLFPLESRHTAYATLGTITEMIRGFILGNLMVGLFISAASTAAFGFLGVPYFYFVGFISGYLSLVPYLGVMLAVLPPVMSGLGKLHGTGFLFVLLTVLGLHLFSLNILYPKFLGRRLQLNPLAVTLSLLFWGWIWGAMGLILAIPMTAAMKIVFDHVDQMQAFGAWLGE